MPLEIRVFDGANPTNMLAVLDGAANTQWTDLLNDVGTGTTDLSFYDAKAIASLTQKGNLVKICMAYPSATGSQPGTPVPVFGFFNTAPKLISDEAEKAVWTLAGESVLNYTKLAAVYPAGWTGNGRYTTTRSFGSTATPTTWGAILSTLIDEAQGVTYRGAIPALTYDFSATNDSAGNAWTANVVLTIGALGRTSILDIIKKFVSLGMGVYMDPNLGLHTYIAGAYGRDLTSQVVLRYGAHIAGPIENLGSMPTTVALVEGVAGAFVEATDTALVSSGYYGRRETGLDYSQVSGDTTQMTTAGNQQIALTELSSQALSLPLTHGTGTVASVTGRYRDTILGIATCVGYFRLSDTTSACLDESVTANSGSHFNTPTLGVAGALVNDVNAAITYTSGSSEYSEMATNVAYDFGTGSYALSFFFKRSGNPGASEFILNRGGATSTGWEAFMSTSGGLCARIGALTVNSATGFADNAWHHAVLVMWRSGVNARWYIDGAISGATVDISAESARDLTAAATVFDIARRAAGSYFNGSIDEVALFAGGLSTSVVNSLHAAAITGPIFTPGDATSGLYEPYRDYKPGDTIALDVPGSYSMSPFAIAALTVIQTASNDYIPTVNLGAVVISGPEALGLAVRQMITSVTGSTSGIGASLAGFLTLGNPRTLGDSVWTAPTFVNSWVNFGGVWNNAGYKKDQRGWVNLRGLIKSGSAATMFTLPSGYRPAGQMQFPMVSNGVFGNLTVKADGTVLGVAPYSNLSVTLDGISFDPTGGS